MISIARLLISQSPSPQPENKGWLELPNGQRIQPKPSQVYFFPGRQKPYVQTVKRHRWITRLLGWAA
ncbi:phage filamentation protein Fil family protein [Brenneria populi]|uniref:Phage filamentation protein Fil family protein n=1 Tax=Brenneria populi TaxID=1505588 RepID=A0ABU6JS93_9GAMM|nr:phage filamentation protein Fil family protein [Brenneria populi Li et al. 2015]